MSGMATGMVIVTCLVVCFACGVWVASMFMDDDE